MKAIGIVTGPRKKGLTDKLVDEALRGLTDRGAETEKVYLIDMTIKPCRGCRSCQDTGRCIIEDDFNPLSGKLRQADVLVFSSPTYFSNVTSCAKRFFDRGYSMFRETPFGLSYLFKKPKKAILITSCDAPFPISRLFGISTGCIRAMTVFFSYMRLKIKTFTVTNAKKFEKIAHSAILKKAYDLGKNI